MFTTYRLDLLKKPGKYLIFALFALGFFLGAYFFFYRDVGGYSPPERAEIAWEQIAPLSASHSQVDDEVPLVQRRMLLVDATHSNDFTKEEIATLISRVVGRGFTVEVIGEAGFLRGFRNMDERRRLALLEEKLRLASSLAVVLPDASYTMAEVDLVEKFVDKGGRLLMVADPTRF